MNDIIEISTLVLTLTRDMVANEDIVNDFGLNKLFSEAEGVVICKRGRNVSCPGLPVHE